MTNHTPGPWEYHQEFNLNKVRKQECSGHIATVWHHECVLGYVDFEEAKANAHLIAASPELLEMCKSLLSEMKTMSLWDDETVKLTDQAEALIARVDK